MAWRVVAVKNPARLKLAHNQLVIIQDQEISLPIEDIDALVIDSYGVVITAELLAYLSTHKTTVIYCDDKHLPCGMLISYSQHSRQAKMSRQQVAMSEPLKKRLWQKNIIAKIINQADVLAYFGLDDRLLRDCVTRVRSGDAGNQESIAARVYFDQLLDDATRRQSIWHNAALNYGYAIVRSHIARHVAARGLIASQGIFHHNELNSFNLVDDLIESYRPVVDAIVIEYAKRKIITQDATLNVDDRRFLVDILNKYVIIKDKRFTLKHSIELTVESFVDCIDKQSVSNLALPKVNF
ncbi:MAG: type II CRISPR-associated endonuclease Cas1 [Candidatus Saccharibacteria bacterium]|nr:type II CRISPR-associated endonuclease Cas1 [Candidatus Saccharibacteria bacterium]